jgi:Family of unknown function (DUF6502)
MVSNTTSNPTLDFLGMVLEPVIRLMLRMGVSWKEFSELSKVKFVAVATREYGIRGRPTNASRVAILTGIDRREIRKLRLAGDQPHPRGYQSKASQVLSAWHHEADFLDADGHPAALPIDGEGATFAELMRRYAPALPLVAMTKELKGAGAIEELPDGRVRPLMRTYVPVGLPAERLRLWASVLSDLASTIEHNFSRDDGEPAWFERRALSLSVDRNALPEFRQLLEAEGQALLERIDDWLSAHELPDGDNDGDAIRLGVGIYHIQDRTTRRVRRKQQGTRN